ncbi:MAG: DUF4375 domain-containing protein [Deltaproteobacteria bacterium]|nr:DUF4375 domain-containing protein [Deltaproteobacteria bacterium]
MAELEFLSKYSGESTTQLLAYEGRCRVDSIVLAFEQAIEAKAAADRTLSSEEEVVLAIEALEREVNNGGYDQFFRNSSKAFAPNIVGALDRIGCPACARITAAALAALPLAGPPTEAAIDRAMAEDSASRSDALSACDADYFRNTEDIAGRLFAFLKANHQSIQLG